jgi:hypothetical protein
MNGLPPAESVSIHQLKAIWVTAYEAVDSSASSQEK